LKENDFAIDVYKNINIGHFLHHKMVSNKANNEETVRKQSKICMNNLTNIKFAYFCLLKMVWDFWKVAQLTGGDFAHYQQIVNLHKKPF